MLAERSDQIVSLVANTNALLASCGPKAPRWIRSRATSRRCRQQLQGFIADNREHAQPALDKLNGVLTIVDNRKERLQKSIKLLNDYAMSLGESVSSGPFFKAYVANLLPASSFSRSSTPRSPISVWTPTCCCRPAHRPADRPARHAGAAGAVPADRAGRRPATRPARRDHRQSRRSGLRPPGMPLPGHRLLPYREPLPPAARRTAAGPPRRRRRTASMPVPTPAPVHGARAG